MQAAANMIAAFDEVSSLILIRELFKCVAKMEKREYNLFSFLKMQSISFVLLVVYYGLQELDLLDGNKWWKIWFELAVPFNSFFSLLILLLVFYYGIHVLLALGKSDQFQSGNSTAAPDKKRQHLVMVIYVLMSAQTLKFVLQIVFMAIGTMALKNVNYCAEKHGNVLGLLECLRPYSSENLGILFQTGDNYCAILEIAVVLCIFIHKTCLKKA